MYDRGDYHTVNCVDNFNEIEESGYFKLLKECVDIAFNPDSEVWSRLLVLERFPTVEEEALKATQKSKETGGTAADLIDDRWQDVNYYYGSGINKSEKRKACYDTTEYCAHVLKVFTRGALPVIANDHLLEQVREM